MTTTDQWNVWWLKPHGQSALVDRSTSLAEMQAVRDRLIADHREDAFCVLPHGLAPSTIDKWVGWLVQVDVDGAPVLGGKLPHPVDHGMPYPLAQALHHHSKLAQWFPFCTYVVLPAGDTPEQHNIQTSTTTKRETEESKTMTTNAPTKNGEAKASEWKWQKMDVEASGEKIIIPDGMNYAEARHWLTVREQAESVKVGLNESFNVFPLEGALAFAKALDRKFGFYEKVAIEGFFKDTPPQMIGVETGVGKVTQVPWGRVQMPGLSGFMETGIGWDGPRPIFKVVGEIKQGDKRIAEEVFELTREILKSESIYKGHALRIRFPAYGEDWDVSMAPKFMDLLGVKSSDLILPALVDHLVRTAILTPIRHTQMCVSQGIPLKRGILLEGPYGTGKTLTARVVAKACEDNEWTFLYLESVAHLERAILFARQYEPCVIFAEDIDRVVSGERSVSMDAILNTIDGVDTKSSKIMVVLTTNHVENINVAMLRPGRLDAVISVTPPDAEAVQRLVRHYARGLIAADADLSGIGQKLNGQIPASIREVVERSKLAVIDRTAGKGPFTLTSPDLEVTADGMLNHLKLLDRKDDTQDHTLANIGHGIGEGIVGAIRDELGADAVTKLAAARANGNGKHKELPAS